MPFKTCSTYRFQKFATCLLRLHATHLFWSRGDNSAHTLGTLLGASEGPHYSPVLLDVWGMWSLSNTKLEMNTNQIKRTLYGLKEMRKQQSRKLVTVPNGVFCATSFSVASLHLALIMETANSLETLMSSTAHGVTRYKTAFWCSDSQSLETYKSGSRRLVLFTFAPLNMTILQ
jgi:hypothetical protein